MLNENAPGLDTSPRLDNHLHRYLIEKSGNAYIRDFFDHSGLYYTMLFDFAAPEASVVSEMAAQHREILTALLAEDWIHAREALARHIRAQVPIVRRLLEKISAEGLANRTGRTTE
jgi:DNA-binding FadR family transcriptional regulator